MPKTSATTAPAFSLDRFVEDVRTLMPIDGHLRYEWLPDGRTTLVFRVLDGGRRGDLAVGGPRTHALFKSVHGVTRAVIVQIKPGWSGPLLGVPAHELTDRIVRIEDLWGRAGSDLYAELLSTRDLPEVLDCMSRAFGLRTQSSSEPASARLARRAARLLESGEARVERVAEQLGITPRHLRRAFRENVGVGPKEYARTVRLKRAVRLAASSNDWSHIAAEAGYYDQAHFIGDFRELVGTTPGAFARQASGAGYHNAHVAVHRPEHAENTVACQKRGSRRDGSPPKRSAAGAGIGLCANRRGGWPITRRNALPNELSDS